MSTQTQQETAGERIAREFSENKRYLTDAEQRRLAGMIDATAIPLAAVTRELRDALAGAMRVLAAADQFEAFMQEMARLGIAPGIGIRADAVLRRVDGETQHNGQGS